jgi:hypothetical protein
MLFRRAFRTESDDWRLEANDPHCVRIVVKESELGKEIAVLGMVMGRFEII